MFTYRLNIQPLSGAEDWPVWSTQTEDILNDMGLLDHILDDAAPPDPVVDSDGKAKPDTANNKVWRTANRRALGQICLRVAPSIIVDIRHAKTALEAWTILRDNYQEDGGIAVILAIRNLFSTRASEESDMQKHLRLMKGYAEDLRSLGYALPNEVISLAFLTSMPDSWDSWVGSTALDDTRLKNTAKTTAAILIEAKRRNPTEPDSVPDAALVARSNRSLPRKPHAAPQSPSNGKSKPMTCYNCGGRGHLSRDCPSDRDVCTMALADHTASDDDRSCDSEEDIIF
ncbi:hypothetical protein MVEN_00016600 [Mycena venus]|uniref:CCHC-type domain-containing protein n=1 Tax=Mycena venus TaxID=2733690 RepID=A0A8H6Z774_9AGAR|nr:hypothetical protein MVEN_00016600 [Mycena venus]